MKRIVYLLIFVLAVSGFSCGKSKEKVITVEKDLKIIPFGRFSRAFNDMNDRHLEAARRLGIVPASSREEALSGNTHLCEITDCEYYKVDSLTHSIPYLVPKAKELWRLSEKTLSILWKVGEEEAIRFWLQCSPGRSRC